MAKGDVCHIEPKTTDIVKTQPLHEGIFDWMFQIFPGMNTYAMFATPVGPGGLGAGFDSGANAEPPPQAGPILHIEATLGRITKAGGKTIAPETRISDEFGYYALFLDNVANRLGLWSQ